MASGKNTEKRIRITLEIIAALLKDKDRTGIGSRALLKGKRKECPPGLYANTIQGWLTGTSQTAREDHINYVRKLWRALPDESECSIPLTEEVRKDLRRKLKDTGLSAKRLFIEREDNPTGFEWSLVHNLIGTQRSKIKKEYYDYILSVCEENLNSGYEGVSEDIKAAIRNEIERTGIPPTLLIRKAARKERPKVMPWVVLNWISGKAPTANQSAVEYVLDLYSKYPDKPKG